jgi:hypothetical protein
MIDGRQVRMSTKKRILKDAKDAARDIYLDYRFRQKNGLPVISKRFADVGALCRATMKECLAPYICPLIFGFSNKVSGIGGRMFNA